MLLRKIIGRLKLKNVDDKLHSMLKTANEKSHKILKNVDNRVRDSVRPCYVAEQGKKTKKRHLFQLPLQLQFPPAPPTPPSSVMRRNLALLHTIFSSPRLFPYPGPCIALCVCVCVSE